MTGVADVYLMLSKPRSKESRRRFAALFQREKKPQDLQKFVVLSWKHSGSSLLCDILHNHPEIIMHKELFNPIDIFTYYSTALLRNESSDNKWNYLSRDLWPQLFLDHIWPGRYADGTKIKSNGKAIGFKSFPEHWKDTDNEGVWKDLILDDFQVKKIILSRDCELSTYVSMRRAEVTGNYLGTPYPNDLKIHVDVSAFQAFVNHYRFTFQRKYKSPLYPQDSFHVTCEQLVDKDVFNNEIAPKLWGFLGVDDAFQVRRLKETVRQSQEDERLDVVISNWHALERAFRHSDVSYFKNRRKLKLSQDTSSTVSITDRTNSSLSQGSSDGTWSILLPICSRIASKATPVLPPADEYTNQYTSNNTEQPDVCWERLSQFAASFAETTSAKDRENVEFIVGIDEDDDVFNTIDANQRIRKILPIEVKVVFESIPPKMYGKVCQIWNRLSQRANRDFIVLFGDDILLLDNGWKRNIEECFTAIQSNNPDLPFGAACVAFNDISFRGFPTFPVIHRFHMKVFGRLLPKQFVNQGGDPFLFELYSRFNASKFASVKLKNTLGGDSSARYSKHEINWKGQVLRLSIEILTERIKTLNQVNVAPTGVCLDIVIPSYRTNNSVILKRIINLRSTLRAYVKFWIVVDNPDKEHLHEVKGLAEEANKSTFKDNNYFVNVVHYNENRGASYARNTGYNYSTADWVIFLDDDIVPEPHLLEAYIGSIFRYPLAKVMVGMTELPEPMNNWTRMLKTSNVMFFFGISKHYIHPPWGVTANIMVKGSRYNHSVQFKHLYPKTGGGEDIDFIFQMKSFHKLDGCVVGVPGATVMHPWWNNSNVCYNQIWGWANGDSQLITEWPGKTYLTLPNWVESMALLGITYLFFLRKALYLIPLLQTCTCIALVDHLIKTFAYYGSAANALPTKKPTFAFAHILFLAFGASTVISAQEVTRLLCIFKRHSLFSFGRRVDW
eukprot:CAMPEP_0194127360 /NCGR_PEP_ID=MMETSP0150-20130528/60480_1 /TAXON_ID=122233 /ORGANISM="Chaetoceros debilis, Strain MM31A-1" /LENGTH=954 /DNA_ID=CAMNT_0038821281 /DNA_START=524 /DNA_END=3385 /DNA_ORIENTATION=+